MEKLPARKIFRRITILLSPLLLIAGLISSLGLYIGVENAGFAMELAENSPQSLPHYLQYQLYRQAPPEGTVLGENVNAYDGKAEHLRRYLEWQDSPLEPYADTFITVAEKYNLPWNLLPAICGRESTFGKKIPVNSHNCWGWGIYGSQSLGFESWETAIDTVGRGLRRDYFDLGLDTILEIEYKYAPPHRETHKWSDGVAYFMWEIEAYPNFY